MLKRHVTFVDAMVQLKAILDRLRSIPIPCLSYRPRTMKYLCSLVVRAFRGIAPLLLLGCAICTAGMAPKSLPTRTPDRSPKSVLLLSSIQLATTGYRESIHTALQEGSPYSIEVYDEYTGLDKYSGEAYELSLLRLYNEKYSGTRVDLILVLAPTALEFVVSRNFLPGVPVVTCYVPQRLVDQARTNRPEITGAIHPQNGPMTLDLMLALYPRTRQVHIVLGASEYERRQSEYASKVLLPRARGAVLDFMNDLSLEQMEARLKALKQDELVLFGMLDLDAAGQHFTTNAPLERLSAASSRPVFGLNTVDLGDGIMGGVLISADQTARASAEVARLVLEGQKASAIPLRLNIGAAPMFDWRQLKRWGLPEHALPPGSIIQFRDLSPWETHWKAISAGVSLFVLESLLVAALMIQLRRRKYIQRDLEDAKVRYQTFADFTHDWEYWQRPDGSFDYISPSCVQVCGYPPEALVEHPETFMRIVFEQDRPAWLAHQEEALRGSRTPSIEFRINTQKGEPRWVEQTNNPIRLTNSGSLGTRGSIRDITGRKLAEAALRESEQRMQLATDSAQLAVWDWDLQAGTMIWDDRMFELYGKTRLEINGTVQDWKDGLHPEDLERALTECEAAIKGEAPFDIEFRVRHRDGTVLWIKANATVLRDLEGNPVRMVGVNRDITDVHLAEEEKAKLQAQLQQSQKMESLGTLAGGVAHDMNNVLGAILGLASAHIGSQPSDSPLHEALGTICKASERGGKMVKSLLSFARQSPVEERQLDLNAILRDQVSLLNRTTLAMIHLQLDLEAGLRPILGDASALTHAFMNLCVNAVDAMPENGTLTLRTRNVGTDWIEVVVEDTGTGMPKEILKKALDPFFTTKGVGKGTGLGLPMVYTTVKAHQGQLEIQSEQGHGTRVMMRFPACAVEAETIEHSDPMEVSVPPKALKVLLVDDDELIQISTQMLLEVLGHTVNASQSGEEALAMLEEGFEPDLAILDMNMPGLGGTGTLPRLRVLRPAMPVLLATGRTDETALTLASAHTGVTLFPKPFGLRELRRHLETLGLG